ncbi:hypothetical protein ASG22_20010 [Chryseobacterium sp. Leaf405]|uniref:hypothetical protein n=1 Tax=Chryseobacterium sp. Leaf405 TaxID=1736367 RepID=UPI0006F97658|nr:hypothetical protein [Chryseobacterium sp. Leaf405]KQT28489.1 hypothetical protein ASG22_20010 [Chryseobacterium sp. Leaf405]
MKEIILKNNSSEILVDSNLSYYLFSCFFIYLLDDNKTLKDVIVSEEIKDLHNNLENYLSEILRKWYEEPSEKELQKYSTRYEKIRLNTKIYKVNYRMSEVGRFVFLLDKIIKMLNDSYINEEKLNIKIKEIENKMYK